MDKIRSQQILPEQRRILEALARQAAGDKPRFLELGSWAGDSTVVLGKVAKEHGGQLYCVDWWRGNEGTELKAIAQNEDVFSHFWQRIQEAGLEDTVIPIRTSTDNAVDLLKHLSFDLIFIDADHRYEPVLRDIQNYAPLVKKGTGILCGHDCEGYLSDFNLTFLKKGKNQDCYQTVHCGVVLAVGELFQDYSIDFGVWSLRRGNTKKRAWQPTRVEIPGLEIKKQPPPPPLAFSKSYNIFRVGKNLVAIPPGQEFSQALEDGNGNGVQRARTFKELELAIKEKIKPQKELPTLIESHHEFNLVSYKNSIYGMHHSLGPLDLAKMSDAQVEKHKLAGKVTVGHSISQIRERVEFLTPIMVRADYKYFNIVKFRNRFYAVAQELGDINDWSGYDFKKAMVLGKCFIADSVEEAETIIDLYYEENPVKAAVKRLKN